MVLRSVKRRLLAGRLPFHHVIWSLSLGHQNCFPIHPLHPLPTSSLSPSWTWENSCFPWCHFSSWFRVESKGLFWESTQTGTSQPPPGPRHRPPPVRSGTNASFTRPLPCGGSGMKACRLPALQPLPCPEVPEFLSGDKGMQGLVWAKVLCWKGGQDLTNFCHIMCEEGEAMAEFRVRGFAWGPPRGSLASGSQSAITLFTSLSLFLYLWKEDNISLIYLYNRNDNTCLHGCHED